MQFTGLRDKNGKEIYEGDIVCVNYRGDDEIDVVEYHGDRDYPAFDLKNNKMESNALSVAADESEKFEVIGSFYEKPELLTA